MDQVDRPTGNRIVRVLEKWLPPHLLRLVAAAPALRNAACAAGFAMLAAAVLAANFRSGPLGTLAFLITAPVVPLMGVALAYSHPDDLCGEVAEALPYSRFKLLLLRTAAVASVTLPVVLMLSLLLPVDLRLALLWLAPSLAMCALTLVLSPFADSRWVAAGLGLVWLVATTVHLPAAPPLTSLHELLAREVLFRPSGQAFLLVVALLAVMISAVLRRTTFETRNPA